MAVLNRWTRLSEFITDPVNKHVASFIGLMNFIDGEYRGVKKGKLDIKAGSLGDVLLEPEQMPTELKSGKVTIELDLKC